MWRAFAVNAPRPLLPRGGKRAVHKGRRQRRSAALNQTKLLRIKAQKFVPIHSVERLLVHAMNEFDMYLRFFFNKYYCY